MDDPQPPHRSSKADDRQLRDDRSFKTYRRDLMYRQNESDWVIKRRTIIASVVRNDVEALKILLDSPTWYKVSDKNGLNLLQIAILQDSKEAFDYMISLEDFPLELVSNYRETALITAILVIDFDVDGDMEKDSDYYALQLVKKGANIFYTDHFGYTTLSCAALKHHVHMAKIFIERGVDLDVQDIDGNTALHAALEHDGTESIEMISLLLGYGCDPHIENKHGLIPFEKSVLYCRNNFIQEILFYYTFNEIEDVETRLSVLLQLGADKSELFHKFNRVVVEDLSDTGYIQIFELDVDYLTAFMEKFQCELMDILPKCTLHEWTANTVTFEKIELLLNSGVREQMLECISNVEEDDYLFEYLINYFKLDENAITEITCYLLSYGLHITEGVVQKIFQRYGYCELFKILLRMDIKIGILHTREIFPAMLYNPTVNIDDYLKNFSKFSIKNMNLLLYFFSNRKLKHLCVQVYGEPIFPKIQRMPRIPLLVELARNVFRKYFIERFDIQTSKEFYFLLQKLQINNFYKKIISYEKKLYY